MIKKPNDHQIGAARLLWKIGEDLDEIAKRLDLTLGQVAYAINRPPRIRVAKTD